jgi:hypothetical protein
MPDETRSAAHTQAHTQAHTRASAGSGFNTPDPADASGQGPGAALAATRSSARLAVPPHCTCGHRPEQHDRVATRYCLATVTSRLLRGCICATPPAEPARQP